MPMRDLHELFDSLPPTMRVGPFSVAIGCSQRTVYRHIRNGMPAIGGRGYAKIVPTRPAFGWLQAPTNKRGRPRNISRGTKSPD